MPIQLPPGDDIMQVMQQFDKASRLQPPEKRKSVIGEFHASLTDIRGSKRLQEFSTKLVAMIKSLGENLKSMGMGNLSFGSVVIKEGSQKIQQLTMLIHRDTQKEGEKPGETKKSAKQYQAARKYAGKKAVFKKIKAGKEMIEKEEILTPDQIKKEEVKLAEEERILNIDEQILAIDEEDKKLAEEEAQLEKEIAEKTEKPPTAPKMKPVDPDATARGDGLLKKRSEARRLGPKGDADLK